MATHEPVESVERKYWYDHEKNLDILIEETYYLDDEKHGQYTKWYNNGTLNIKTAYKNGKRDGLYEEWHDNGNIFIKTTYINYKNGSIIKTDSWDCDGKRINTDDDFKIIRIIITPEHCDKK